MLRAIGVIFYVCWVGAFLYVEGIWLEGGSPGVEVVKEAEPLCFICRKPNPTNTTHYGYGSEYLHHAHCKAPEKIRTTTRQPYTKAVMRQVPGKSGSFFLDIITAAMVSFVLIVWNLPGMYVVGMTFRIGRDEDHYGLFALMSVPFVNFILLTIWMRVS